MPHIIKGEPLKESFFIRYFILIFCDRFQISINVSISLWKQTLLHALWLNMVDLII